MLAFFFLPSIVILAAVFSLAFLKTPNLKRIALVSVLFVVFLGGYNALNGSAKPLDNALSPTLYSILQEVGARLPVDSTLLALSIAPIDSPSEKLPFFVAFLQQGATALSGRRSVESIVMPIFDPRNLTTNLPIYENCFAGFKRNGFNFVVEECPPVSQDLCSYDYVFMPVSGGFGTGELSKRLVEKALSIEDFRGALLLKINKQNCI